MKHNEKAREAVEAVWGNLQRELGVLADELGSSDDDSWDGDSSDAASVGSAVKDLTDELAGALSEWLPEIPAHDKLDAFLHELASRRRKPVFGQAAEASAEMLEFLRHISYGALPHLDKPPPDAEDLSQALEGLLKELGVAT